MKQTNTKQKNEVKSVSQKDTEPATITETKTDKLVCLVALQDTQLADGTFVKKGSSVRVTAEYANRCLSEPNAHFSKTN